MIKIETHADDYGLTMEASKKILQCVKEEKLSAVSILPNMSCFDKAASLWKKEMAGKKQPLISVHLNFMEGYALAEPSGISYLVDEKGLFKLSWIALVKFNYNKSLREELKIQLKREIEAQLSRVITTYDLLNEGGLRVDSHQHTHMIPLVMESLLEVIKENNYPTEYIRLSKEMWTAYIKKPLLYLTYRPVNIVKVMILNYFALTDEKHLKEAGIPSMILCGVFFSGNMDYKRVGSLLPDLQRAARNKKVLLEVLFHPGQAVEEEMGDEFNQDEGREFYLSKGRKIEFEALNYFSKIQNQKKAHRKEW